MIGRDIRFGDLIVPETARPVRGRELGDDTSSRGFTRGSRGFCGGRAARCPIILRVRALEIRARTSVTEYHSGGIKIEANANRRTGSPPRHPARFILPRMRRAPANSDVFSPLLETHARTVSVIADATVMQGVRGASGRLSFRSVHV